MAAYRGSEDEGAWCWGKSPANAKDWRKSVWADPVDRRDTSNNLVIYHVGDFEYMTEVCSG